MSVWDRARCSHHNRGRRARQNHGQTWASDPYAARQTLPIAASQPPWNQPPKRPQLGRWRLISIRRPGMQRHRRNLESQPRCHQAHGARRSRLLPCRA